MDPEPTFASPADEIAYWKQQAEHYRALAADTQQQFEEFQQDSRELEHELEQQLEGLEAKVKDTATRLERTAAENGDLKEKLNKAKEMARAEVIALEAKVTVLSDNEKKLKAKIRELEQTTDDFERFERVTTSSLTEAEIKYNMLVEKTILLEQEIEEKETMREEMQRLKDEMRDLELELHILRTKQPQLSTQMQVDPAPVKPVSASTGTANGESVDPPRSANSASSTNANASSSAVLREMLSRVKTLEKRLVTCRSIVKAVITEPSQ